MFAKFNKQLVIAAALLLGLAAGPAKAAMVTLDLATIDSFIQLASSHAGTSTVSTPSSAFGDDNTFFSTTFEATAAFQTADVGITGAGFDWTGYDSFGLQIANVNESDWTFEVFVVDGSAVVASSGSQLLNPDFTYNSFVVDLATLDVSNIDSVFIRISANIPNTTNPGGTNDRVSEYRVKPIPEPSALLLMGLGLGVLGFAVARRKA